MLLSLPSFAGVGENIYSPTPGERFYTKDAYKGYSPVGLDGEPLNYSHPENPQDDPLFKREYARAHPGEVPPPELERAIEQRAVTDKWNANLSANDVAAMADGKTLGEWKDENTRLISGKIAALDQLNGEIKGKKYEPGTPGYWVNSYYDLYQKATENGLLNTEKFAGMEAQWATENGAEAMRYIDAYAVQGKDPGIAQEYRKAIAQLSADGYFTGAENSIPRYTGMTSGLTDKQITDAANKVSELANNDPKYAVFKDADFATKAFAVLKPLGFSMAQIIDISNSNKKDYVNPKFALYKLRHPELTAWLNDNMHYSTIKAIEADKD